MNFLILGDGPVERAWAASLTNLGAHRVVAAFPGLTDWNDSTPTPAPAPARPRDLDDALAFPGVEAVVVGGDPAFRAEALRRVAAEGLPAVCLHPPGPDSEAYYVVSMSREETGAVLVPDLAERLHPGVVSLRQALQRGELGGFRGLRYEATVEPGAGDLARFHFARAVDVVRSLLGEVDGVSATGDPPGTHPDESLVVQLRGASSRRAEVRLSLARGKREPTRLVLTGSEGSLSLELDPPSRLVRLSNDGVETVRAIDPWDPFAALTDVLERAIAGHDAHPDLLDATRAMEVTEGVVRSLRRGRTIELHYEEISESGTFKSVMTSLGCLILFSVLFVVPLALAGPALGVGWTIYLAYLIPPALVGFVLLQLLRFAIRGPSPSPGKGRTDAPTDE